MSSIGGKYFDCVVCGKTLKENVVKIGSKGNIYYKVSCLSCRKSYLYSDSGTWDSWTIPDSINNSSRVDVWERRVACIMGS